MYVYFDSQGILKEVITEHPFRQGSQNYNKVYVYCELFDTLNVALASFWFQYSKPQLSGDDPSIYKYPAKTFTVDAYTPVTIPVNPKRDLKFFEEGKEYKMIEIPTTFEVDGITYNVLSSSGDLGLVVQMDVSGELNSFGMFVFHVEPTLLGTEIAEDTEITVAQFNYLKMLIDSLSLDVSHASNLHNGDGTGSLEQVRSSLYFSFGGNTYIVENTGNYSASFGLNRVTGNYAFAEGNSNVVEGNNSHAEGTHNIVKGRENHAEGDMNVVDGRYNHVEGQANEALDSAYYCHVTGTGNKTSLGAIAQFICGQVNDNSDNTVKFMVGNGSGGVGSNAFEVRNDGTARVAAQGTNAKDVTQKGYVDNQDAATLLDAEEYSDDHLFVMSVSPTVLTDDEFDFLSLNNVRIEYNDMYYEKSHETDSLIIWTNSSISQSTHSDGYQVITKRAISLNKGTKRLDAGTISFNIYNVSQTDAKFYNKTQVDNMIATIKSNQIVIVDTSTYPTLADFLASTGEEGEIYLYPDANGYGQYIWEGSQWIYLGDTGLVFENYYTKTEIDALDAQNVKLTGNQSISGTKTFNADIRRVYGTGWTSFGAIPGSNVPLLISWKPDENTSAKYLLRYDITDSFRIFDTLNPSTTATYDLGSSTYKWRNLYLSGNITDGTHTTNVANLVDLVHTVGDEEIAGDKTFTNQIILKDGIEFRKQSSLTHFKMEEYHNGSDHFLYIDNGTNSIVGTFLKFIRGTSKQQIEATDIAPKQDNSQDLGTTSKTWKDFYAKGKISNGTDEVNVDDVINRVNGFVIEGADPEDVPADVVAKAKLGDMLVFNDGSDKYIYICNYIESDGSIKYFTQFDGGGIWTISFEFDSEEETWGFLDQYELTDSTIQNRIDNSISHKADVVNITGNGGNVASNIVEGLKNGSIVVSSNSYYMGICKVISSTKKVLMMMYVDNDRGNVYNDSFAYTKSGSTWSMTKSTHFSSNNNIVRHWFCNDITDDDEITDIINNARNGDVIYDDNTETTFFIINVYGAILSSLDDGDGRIVHYYYEYSGGSWEFVNSKATYGRTCFHEIYVDVNQDVVVKLAAPFERFDPQNGGLYFARMLKYIGGTVYDYNTGTGGIIADADWDNTNGLTITFNTADTIGGTVKTQQITVAKNDFLTVDNFRGSIGGLGDVY